MDNVCQDNVTFDDRNLICMIMMIATNSKSFEALLSVTIETFLVTCNTIRFFLKMYRNYQTCSSNAKGMSLAQTYLFIMVKKSKMFYLPLSDGSKYLSTGLWVVISVAYGYIRQIMVIHGGDDCTITVMTMMTTTMLFLMRNMKKSSN